jgi:hypothetical protein
MHTCEGGRRIKQEEQKRFIKSSQNVMTDNRVNDTQ